MWEAIQAFTLEQQQDEGDFVDFRHPLQPEPGRATLRGFTYVKKIDVPDRGEPTGAMTACGLSTLLMTKHILSGEGQQILVWSRRPDVPVWSAAYVDGLAWLARHTGPFPFLDPGKKNVQVNHVYWLWMLECAMDLAGDTHLGRTNWYRAAGGELVKRQRPDGSWNTGGTWKPCDVLDTAFAILFLKRACRNLIPP